MNYHEAPMKDLVCPLGKSKGTLRPITPKRRFVAGRWSSARLLSTTHECTACGATFETQQLVHGHKAA